MFGDDADAFPTFHVFTPGRSRPKVIVGYNSSELARALMGAGMSTINAPSRYFNQFAPSSMQPAEKPRAVIVCASKRNSGRYASHNTEDTEARNLARILMGSDF